ncbi:MAG: prenyltransferase [Chloroflexi bacterium]|nr:prenyltransferase [Chloroflexota bacterium]
MSRVEPEQAPAGRGGPRLDVRDLLLASRPISWINTGLPFLAAAWEVERGFTPALVLGTIYFLGPFNLLLYGVNDLFDYDSDIRNPRKGSVEGGLVAPAQGSRLWAAVLLTNVPLLIALGLLGGAAAAAALAVTVLAALVYSAPPLRTKERPLLDSFTSALHFVLPAVCGFLVTGAPVADLPWLLLGGFMAWGMASHAIGAAQDVTYDRAAGIGSIATALGVRATGLVALAGYVLAIGAALSVGLPYGPVAAAALAPYLLLPVLLLVRPSELRSRRAWRSFMGLNFVSGFVLAQGLLRYWEITTYDAWALLSTVAAAASGVVLLFVVATRLATRRRAGAGRGAAAVSGLTVVVPCRDEAARLPAALDALVAQDLPGLRVVVVDDGSADGSAGVAAACLAPLGSRATVVAAPSRPAGWDGKSWAVRHGMTVADTPFVLSLDADTVLAPGACRELVAVAAQDGADLVSGVTRYDMRGALEQALVPGFPLLMFGFVPLWLSAATRGRPSALAFAYGPIELVRRDVYEATGGHAAAAGSACEDVDLARTIARAGGRVATVHAADLGATRHYRSAGEVASAWQRVLMPYAGHSLAVALAALVAETAAFILPLVLPLAALASGAEPAVLAGALVPLAILAAARLALAIGQAEPLVTIAWHPLTGVSTILFQAWAIGAWLLGRPARWRGRLVGDAPPTPPRSDIAMEVTE